MSSIVYTAFGDSITEGYGIKKNFVSILSTRIAKEYPTLELRTVNAGMSGDNSRDGLYRLERDVLECNPDLVTVNFGVNDAFSGISVSQYEDNLRKIAGRIAASGCEKIVLLSCEAIPEKWAEKQVLPYWDAMEDAAEKTGCIYADVHGRWLAELMSGRPESELLIPGDMHPNEEGHRIIAEAVWQAIEENGLLEGLRP